MIAFFSVSSAKKTRYEFFAFLKELDFWQSRSVNWFIENIILTGENVPQSDPKVKG